MEMLIVVTIIGVMVGVAFPSITAWKPSGCVRPAIRSSAP